MSRFLRSSSRPARRSASKPLHLERLEARDVPALLGVDLLAPSLVSVPTGPDTLAQVSVVQTPVETALTDGSGVIVATSTPVVDTVMMNYQSQFTADPIPYPHNGGMINVPAGQLPSLASGEGAIAVPTDPLWVSDQSAVAVVPTSPMYPEPLPIPPVVTPEGGRVLSASPKRRRPSKASSSSG